MTTKTPKTMNAIHAVANVIEAMRHMGYGMLAIREHLSVMGVGEDLVTQALTTYPGVAE
jgi:SOS response regulatory protein OraA/RecX